MIMNQKRRILLKSSLAASLVTALGVFSPRALLAAWTEAAFSAKSLDDALKEAFGDAAAEASDAIDLQVPEVAENGAVVPVKIKTKLDNVEAIALLAENNASPLCCIYRLGKGAKAGISIRIKMGKTGDVVAVVKADGKLYSVRKGVKVTAGGC